tara:strand:- start:175 stop:435 length:261 start_codon:yes stop_codon:yes gene_type:complete
MMTRFRPASLTINCITTDTSILIAISRDYNFVDIFSRQLEAWGKGDLLIVISTSGNSPYIIQALKMAKKMNISTHIFSRKRWRKVY